MTDPDVVPSGILTTLFWGVFLIVGLVTHARRPSGFNPERDTALLQRFVRAVDDVVPTRVESLPHLDPLVEWRVDGRRAQVGITLAPAGEMTVSARMVVRLNLEDHGVIPASVRIALRTTDPPPSLRTVSVSAAWLVIRLRGHRRGQERALWDVLDWGRRLLNDIRTRPVSAG